MPAGANPYWDECQWEPYGEGPRDPVVDQAKEEMKAFFEAERTGVFYKQQLEVIFEDTYFHWVTSREATDPAERERMGQMLECLSSRDV